MALLTDADRARMGTIHPDMTAALKTRPFPDLTNGNPNATFLDIRHARAAHLAALRHLYPIPGPIPSEVQEKDHHIPTRDGSTIRVRVYTPVKPSNGPRPLIIMFHEGGWTMGDLTDEEMNCRMFSRDLNAVCINVEYRLAFEHPFPTGVNDAYDAVRWAAKTASPSSDILPADPKRAGFIVGGASAGGNFAAIMCQIARDEKLEPPLTGQFLCVPALLSEGVVPEKWKVDYRSRFQNVLDPVLKMDPDGSRKLLEAAKVVEESPLFSPLLHENLGALPAAFLQVAGLDPLRDEALIYERELRGRGTKTRLEVFDGFGHMFWTNWPELQQSKDFVKDTLAGVQWLLEQNQ